MSSAFDRVIVTDAMGVSKIYSAQEFLALPLDVRIKHILARDIEFFHGSEKLTRAEALKSLRTQVAPGARSR